MAPFYRAVNYPGVTVELFAIRENGKAVRLNNNSIWTICDVRKYAHESGYTHESLRREDGLSIFEWRKP